MSDMEYQQNYDNMISVGGVDETKTYLLLEQILKMICSTDFEALVENFNFDDVPVFNCNHCQSGSSPSSSRGGGTLIVSNTPSQSCGDNLMSVDSGALHGSTASTSPISRSVSIFSSDSASARDLPSSSTHKESPAAGDLTELPSSAKDRNMKRPLQGLTGSTAQHNLSQKDASTHCGKVEPECIMELDYSSEFTTSKIFKNRDALKKWASAAGKKNGFVVVVKRSDAGAGSKKQRIIFGCERSGYYRGTRKNTELDQDKKLKMIGTKKCRCPFELKGKKLDTNKDWRLHVICGKHNHPIVSPTTAEKGTASTQDTTWIVTVQAMHGDSTAKFQITSTSGINELKEKVARRLELELGSFNVKYEDGGTLMLIACDEALKEYVECSTSSLSNKPISLVVTDKVSNSGSSCKKSKSGKGKSPAI